MPQQPLASPWRERRPSYDFIVVGSGYGGAITAARLASAGLDQSVCILERGREWPVGTFPDTFEGLVAQQRNSLNPLGLYELLTYRDISVIKGSGLGGTSLVNANVAIVPRPEVFRLAGWPAELSHDNLLPYYGRAKAMLRATPHPRAAQLAKVQALDRRARELNLEARPLDITVNFDREGINEHGAEEHPCIDCGDCVTGCNVGAKNTLYMNYLPKARRAGTEIYTQTKVEWIEKRSGGGWRVHGRHYTSALSSDEFTLDAAHVILAAGSINSTEILMRSEMHGLRISPRVGTAFGGNGDFFGLAYNGDHRTEVLGFGNHPASSWNTGGHAPGPTIVAAVHYDGHIDVTRATTIEDLSFPRAYVDAARLGFAILRGEDTDTGDERAERDRLLRDTTPFAERHPDGAMNHTMLYLCMGFDDARGSMVFEAPLTERDGRMNVQWQSAGSQIVFTRLNEELRRHARAQGGSFIQNPMWSIFNLGHLITAHPLGGCPIGTDYEAGAVDQYGRVFSADGGVHDGLFVADGALIPTALGVNPFLTISALAERIAERKIEQLQGSAYPEPVRPVAVTGVDPLEAVAASEPELERLFRRTESKPIHWMLNSGTRAIDSNAGLIRNDEYWKGFFPRGHVLNAMSAAIFTGFRKRFFEAGGSLAGITSDTDGRINARNSLEEITVEKRTGDLEPGRYILLRYVDPPWQGFYDIFKVVNENLLIGRVYMGIYPHGVRMFTFPMSRLYSFAQMTVEDHRRLWETAAVPAAGDVAGVWRMDTISNANHATAVARLAFEPKPDGRLEARYRLLGLMEGLVMPEFLTTHFGLRDFTPFHDEIRSLGPDLLIGKYVTELPPAMAATLPAASVGILHVEGDAAVRRFGFYYLLRRETGAELPANPLLSPFLDTRSPDGVGMTFDEEMVGWYQPGLAAQPEEAAAPQAAVECSFNLRMTVRDLNEFIEGWAHEARASGTLRFGSFEGFTPATYVVDPRRSLFRYLTVNPDTGEAEMRYHLEFRSTEGREFVFEGRKYMQKNRPAGAAAVSEVLEDYTTQFYTVSERSAAGLTPIGAGVLKFRTFEDLPAIGNLAGFLRSFAVTGTDDPRIRLQAQMRFLAFTAQFVQREYDPLALPLVSAQGGGN